MIIPMTSARFLACIPLSLIQECPDPTNWSSPTNFSNDANDPGGATQCGITQETYDQYRLSKGQAMQSVQQSTQAEGYDIYYNMFWLPNCPLLMPGMDLCFNDASINQGPTGAIRILQAALAVSVDGIWGPITQAAVSNITNVVTVIEKFTSRREAVYQQTRNFNYFGTDWMRRAEEIGAAAERAGVIQVKALAMHRKFMASKEYLK
jgi:lysozyme family protein